ncbi:MAG: hypothetical protein EOO43_01880 [Flavobacterium sp.]|nr:MAG: hypothetical protein EOO43_01880 [Flavobacterium sp.]
MILKQNIPQSKVTRDINIVPINIVDPRILEMFNTPDIINSTVYINDNGKGKTEVWHSQGNGLWDCVTVSK